MWPFGSRPKQLPPEEQQRLRRRLRAERTAYQACLKANAGDVNSCRQLEVRLLERYSELVCPEKAADYQLCYSASLACGDTVLDSCSKQVDDMRRCVSKLGIDLKQ